MADDEFFPVIIRHRLALVETLSGLTPEEWSEPSWRAGSTVHAVVAHLVARIDAGTGPPAWRAVRGQSQRRRARLEASWADRRPTELTDRLRSLASRSGQARGWRATAVLAELLLHIRDIERPLRRPCQIEPEATAIALRFVTGDRGGALLPADRCAGLRLDVVDLDLRLGAGSRVEGPGEAILLALAGRRGALAGLGGPGAAILARRLAITRC